MCWDHLPWNEKRGCRFLGVQSTTIYKCQNRYRYRRRFQNFVRTLWRFMVQRHGCSSKPKCGLSLKEVAQPPRVLPAAPRGRRRVGARWGAGVASQADRRPALMPQGRGGSATSPPTPAPAQPLWRVRVKGQPRCASSASRGRLRLLMERSLLGSESLLFTSYQAGVSITFFSVSLTVRS